MATFFVAPLRARILWGAAYPKLRALWALALDYNCRALPCAGRFRGLCANSIVTINIFRTIPNDNVHDGWHSVTRKPN